MASVVSHASTAAAAADQPVTTAAAVNVYCVEATAENTEAMRALLSSLQRGTSPTAAVLAAAGMCGMELTAGVDNTVEDIRDVVERQRLSRCQGTTAAAGGGEGDARLTFFAVSRSLTTRVVIPENVAAAKESDEADDEDPLVALSDTLSLGQMLDCPQIFVTDTAEADPATHSAAAPTLLLFYTSASRWGGYCCCCGGLVAAILAIFCCCCYRRSRPRQHSQRPSRSSSANPLGNNGGCSSNSSTTGYYYTNQPGVACGNGCGNYPAYNGNNATTTTTAYAAVPQAQMYYPPPPPVYGEMTNNSGGNQVGYYKPV